MPYKINKSMNGRIQTTFYEFFFLSNSLLTVEPTLLKAGATTPTYQTPFLLYTVFTTNGRKYYQARVYNS